MRAALVQLNSGDDPAANLPVTAALIDEAASNGAGIVLTPEVTNCVSASATRQREVLRPEDADETLKALADQAAARGIWLLIGSLALKTRDPQGRFANRSLLLSPEGRVMARYDKIHMFDVAISATESYRESSTYRPGRRAVLADLPAGGLGMTICYDLRFGHLYRRLARAGAEFLAVPSAFSPVTGRAHWEPLLRARAIETGCYVLAPAQSGSHAATRGRIRKTHGHSLAVSPWGEVLAEAGEGPGVIYVDLDAAEVAKARERIPSLAQEAEFDGP